MLTSRRLARRRQMYARSVIVIVSNYDRGGKFHNRLRKRAAKVSSSTGPNSRARTMPSPSTR